MQKDIPIGLTFDDVLLVPKKSSLKSRKQANLFTNLTPKINLNIPINDSFSQYYSSEINIENEIINELHLKKAINQSDFF